MGVDTIIVFDTHWLVNSAYHINCADHFQGVYTSNELPHFIRDMTYDYDGNPELGQLIADEAVKLGVRAKAHNIPSLKLEYGTLVPMRYMNSDKHFKVVSISAFCTVHDFADSRRLGEAILKAIEKYDGTVAVLASGSLSHRFIDDQRAEEGMNSYTREFDHQMDERVVKLWREGKFKEFCTMLPEYADYCYGEGNMHDTVMLLGLLGWDKYDGKVEFITELFASSGTARLTPCSRCQRRRKGAPCRILSPNVPTTSASRPICLGCSPKSTRRWPPPASFRSRDPQPRPLAGYLADGRRQAGLRLRAYDPEDRRRRSLESRQDVGDMLFALIKSHFATLMESRYLALSFAMEELDPTLNYKQNNVHALFK
ncbi:3,4-dihydroxyphenylacetate 2,3-dioxygenase [Serratia liquefaciens]|nr:3,4-dihydroxyphenylacetate 2,3-dioxygenase [Serratia liquefaciens]